MKYEIDPEYLFSPINGAGKMERAVVESFFKVNYTHRFNVGRITRPGKTAISLKRRSYQMQQHLKEIDKILS